MNPKLSPTKQKQIAALQRKADGADVAHGSVDHRVLLKRIKHLKKGGTRRWESLTPAKVVEQLLHEGAVYIRVGSPEGYEPEGEPSYYGPFNSVRAAEDVINKFPAFERVDQGVYDYDDGQTQLTCNVMLALPTGVGAKLPSAFEGDWAWTVRDETK